MGLGLSNNLADSLGSLQLHVSGGTFGRRLDDDMYPLRGLETGSQELFQVFPVGLGQVLNVAGEDGVHTLNYSRKRRRLTRTNLQPGVPKGIGGVKVGVGKGFGSISSIVRCVGGCRGR